MTTGLMNFGHHIKCYNVHIKKHFIKNHVIGDFLMRVKQTFINRIKMASLTNLEKVGQNENSQSRCIILRVKKTSVNMYKYVLDQINSHLFFICFPFKIITGACLLF